MEPKRNGFFERLGNVREMLDVLERIPGALFMIKDLDSRYVYMSRGLREAIHIEPGQEVVGKTDFDLFPKIVAQNFRENDLKVFREGLPLVNEIHAAIFFRHTPLWAISSKYPLRDRDGCIIGLITINEPYEKVAGGDEELIRLLPAVEHLTKRYAEPFVLATLARSCGYSERHFLRLFKRRLHQSPGQFLEQVRLFHALDAVRHSNHSIARIAGECGYYDPSVFVKRFKRFVGTTPLKCRREFQAGIKKEPGKALPGLLL
ncbi:MAG: AraC family transcriptional regulator [Verrucomicrobiae bacterium]|nr:AraC family transcriptional regulator [Verrucomicrobiae bacterium]